MSTERTCGGCTACCKTHALLSDPEKLVGKWCKHCQIGRGCKIYTERPKECAQFKCQWLLGAGTLDDRPDKRKIVLDLFVHPILQKETCGIWEVSEGALESSFAQEMRRRLFAAKEIILQVSLTKPICLLLPEDVPITDELLRECAKDQILLQTYKSSH